MLGRPGRIVAEPLDSQPVPREQSRRRVRAVRRDGEPVDQVLQQRGVGRPAMTVRRRAVPGEENKSTRSASPRHRAVARASTTAREGCTGRACSSEVYQAVLTPARSATSSRRSPGVRLRRRAGSPTCSGCRRERLLRRNAASSARRGSCVIGLHRVEPNCGAGDSRSHDNGPLEPRPRPGDPGGPGPGTAARRGTEQTMADVVVIGAGSVGSATALHLRAADPSLDVVLVEPDPTYAKAATGKGTGGIRQLFTRPENILLSQYTLDVIDDWANWASIDGAPAPELGWRQNGYFFAAGADDVAALEANFATQTRNGVAAEWLDRAELARRYPELHTDDLVAGVLSPRDGWLNPKVFFQVLRAKALQIERVPSRVMSVTRSTARYRGVPAAVTCHGERPPHSVGTGLATAPLSAVGTSAGENARTACPVQHLG